MDKQNLLTYSTSDSSKKDSVDSKDSTNNYNMIVTKFDNNTNLNINDTTFNTTGINTNNIQHKMIDKIIVVFEEILEKKSPWLHYNTRLLKLYNNVKMEHYKNDTELRVNNK